MTWFMNIRNNKTGEHSILEVFSPVEAGTIIGWGSDDGGRTTAMWTVQSCQPVVKIKEV